MRLSWSKALSSLNGERMSSACSGCDIAFLSAEEMLSFWSTELGEPCSLTHGFACEHAKEKQQFLQTQFSLESLFHDVSELGKARGHDLITGQGVFVKGCYLFTAGFSCKSRTPLSSRSSANRNCLQNHQSDAETSYTFDHIMSYITRHTPTICILENVPALLQKDSNSASDAEWIISQLEMCGYYARWWKFGAEDFGSRAARQRVYFVAWSLPRLNKPATSRLRRTLAEKLQWLEQLFQCLSMEPIPASSFISCVGSKEQIDSLMLSEEESPGVSKSRKAEPKWQDEHCAAFREAGLLWPMCAEERVVQVDGGNLHKLYLTERAAELLFYLHQVFPFEQTAEVDEPQFCDVNPTLARSTQNGSPWKVICPTLTGASQMCVRYKESSKVVVRPLSGRECMALIGWDVTAFKSTCIMDDVLLRNFAGNAFSAFQFVPMLMMAIGGLQTIEGHDASAEMDAVEGEHALTPDPALDGESYDSD